MARRIRGRATTLCVAAVAALALAGCTSGRADNIASNLTTTTTIAPPTIATTTTTAATVGASPQQAVIDGWVAAENTIAQAELAGNARDPMIEQTMVDPQLTHLIGYISTVLTTGGRFTGRFDPGHPVVTAFSPSQATVHSCMDDGIIVVDTTGKPLPTSAGQHTWDSATVAMVLAPTGKWVMKSGTVKSTPWSANTTCPA
jgi:hypothetical protein